MDKLHPTLLSAHLDKKWWPEILLAVNYLRNLSPSTVIGKTPYEAWYGEKPDLSHIAYRLHCLRQKDRIQTPKASQRKSLTLQAIGVRRRSHIPTPHKRQLSHQIHKR